VTKTSILRRCTAGLLALQLLGLVILYPMAPSEIPIHLSVDGTVDTSQKTPITWGFLWAVEVAVVLILQPLTSWLARPDVWAHFEAHKYQHLPLEDQEYLRENLKFVGTLATFLMAVLLAAVNAAFALAAIRRTVIGHEVGMMAVSGAVVSAIVVSIAATVPAVRRLRAAKPTR